MQNESYVKRPILWFKILSIYLIYIFIIINYIWWFLTQQNNNNSTKKIVLLEGDYLPATIDSIKCLMYVEHKSLKLPRIPMTKLPSISLNKKY